MKKVIAGLMFLMAAGCQENETTVNDLTGNEVVNALQSGSVYPISGTVTIKEKKDGSALVIVELNGTEGNIQHPVHLHMGDISAPGAEVAALLTPVTGSTGKSETILTRMADETSITYAQLMKLDACIKIHLADAGPDRNIILAGGNIGSASNAKLDGRVGFGICKSE
jgi:hypothetical protein